jgi:SpoVK/Ycf46/Vps4 family AAA+-type ATPase
MPIYQIDLSSVVSKWVGETEKNLKAIFKAARGVKGILLFDEGDAIFGQRTDVKGSQDRYNNLEVNYLLQELEAFEGIVILSTNYERNLDDAFSRRFTYTINFGFPSAEEREKIWKANLPPELPLAPNVDFKALAIFALSGGNIKNCIRDGAAIAVAKGQTQVEQVDFLWAVKRESQKLGIEFSRESVGEQYWRKVGPEWEYLHFAKKPTVVTPLPSTAK